MNKLVIIGAAELGGLIHHLARQSGDYEVVGYYDDHSILKTFNALPVFGKTDRIIKDHQSGKFDFLFIAIGYNHMLVRENLFKQFSGKIPFATIIHNSAYVDRSSNIGEGSVIFPGCVIDQFVTIGKNVLLNTAVSVSHHSSIDDHCFLAPRVAVAGRVNISQNCFIGIGSIIKDLVNIKDNCIIGAGSLVLKDVESNKKVYGVPAKVVEDNIKS
ncbi:MAG: acetyltransferase [Bacteroidia bacterium]